MSSGVGAQTAAQSAQQQAAGGIAQQYAAAAGDTNDYSYVAVQLEKALCQVFRQMLQVCNYHIFQQYFGRVLVFGLFLTVNCSFKMSQAMSWTRVLSFDAFRDLHTYPFTPKVHINTVIMHLNHSKQVNIPACTHRRVRHLKSSIRPRRNFILYFYKKRFQKNFKHKAHI